MAKSKQYQKLLDKRANAVRALQHHETTVKNLNPSLAKSYSYATITLPIIEASYERYQKITADLEDDDEFGDGELNPSVDSMLDLYIILASTLRDIINEKDNQNGAINMNSTSIHNNSNMQSHNMQDLKLPRLSIPTFSGRFDEWTTFYDTFSTYVDSSSIADVNKMHYLKASVTGTAKQLIQNLPPTDANYKLAWELMYKRFNNVRAIVNACFRKLFEQKPIQTPNANNIRSLIDTTRQALQGIETLKVKIDEWDPMLVYIIQTKMDSKTMSKWETELKGSTEIPTFDSIIEFLEVQFRIYEAASLPGSSNSSTIISTIKVNNNKRKDKCIKCQGEHWLFFCPVFDEWSVDER